MDILGIIDVPMWLLLIVAVFGLYYFYMSKDHGIFKKMGVPGPDPSPILGNFVSLAKQGVIKMDIDLYKKHNRVYGIFEGKFPVLNIGRPELVKQIMVKDFSNFVNRRSIRKEVQSKPLDKAINVLTDDDWKFIRNTITPTFSGKKLRDMTPLIHNASDRLLANIKPKANATEDINIKQAFGGYTMDVIASTAFGMEVDSQKNPNDPFVVHCQRFFDTKILGLLVIFLILFPFSGPFIGFINTRFNRFKWLLRVLQQAIDDRKRNPGNSVDFLELVLRAQKETNGSIEGHPTVTEDPHIIQRGMTDNEIMAQSLLFLVAGFETTAASLTYTLYFMALHPKVAEKALEEINSVCGNNKPTYDNVKELTYLEMCISESLRLYPPAPRLDRVASNDVELDGIKIPKGMAVAIPVQAIHMDPEFWPNPEVYDPERFTAEAKASRDPFTYLPFGHGPRNCIGMRLALLEQKIALARVLQMYKPVRCEKTQVPLKMSKLGNFIDPKVGVWIKLEPRT